MLDQQVIRAALKAFQKVLSSRSSPSSSTAPLQLSPSADYLRLLVDPSNTPPILDQSVCWHDPATSVTLLEWRAALLVHELAQTAKNPDANMYQRVSKAVTEAFVAARVGEMIAESGRELAATEAGILAKLFNLVRYLCYYIMHGR